MNNSGQAGGKSRLSSLRYIVSEQQLLTSVNTESPIFIWPSGIVNVADNPGHDLKFRREMQKNGGRPSQGLDENERFK
ncbi:uncharacterized protein UDID_17301 [Ustilago sp. UG-2017a]|nr:uncharacterized protein UDID_17301 [Ustilago sp. UG-2017a]